MIKKILSSSMILIIIILLYQIIFPGYMTSKNYLKEKVLPIKKKYEDISLYNSSCDEREILTVAVYYLENKKYKECKEWIERRNKCIFLNKRQNKKMYRTYESMCEENSTRI